MKDTASVQSRTAVITDWRTKDEDLPDLAPGDECERVIQPQQHVLLYRIITRGVSLVCLRVGAVLAVPFELERTDGEIRHYQLKIDSDTRAALRKCAPATVVVGDAIGLMPALEVWLMLRNEGDLPTKPRAALLVHVGSAVEAG